MPRIVDFRIHTATSRESKPIADATHTISEISFFVVELDLDTGERGQGYLLAFDYLREKICLTRGEFSVFNKPV